MENQEPVENIGQEENTEDDNYAKIVYETGEFIKNIAKEYAEKYGDDALRAGVTGRIFFAVMTPAGIAINTFVDVTLGDEPVEQAVLSQLAAAAVGTVAAFFVLGSTSSVFLAAVIGGGLAITADYIVDSLYPIRDRFIDAGYPPLPPGSFDTRSCHPSAFANTGFSAAQATTIQRRDPLTLDLDGDGLETVGIDSANPILFDHDGDGIKTATGWIRRKQGTSPIFHNSPFFEHLGCS